MSHLRMTRSQLFAIEMVRLALEHPAVTSVNGYSNSTLWQSLEFTSEDHLSPTIKITRHLRRVRVVASCKMEFDNRRMTSGSVVLTSGIYSWSFTARVLEGSRMEVTGERIS